MTKRLAILLLIAALAPVAVFAQTYTAILNGANEAPAAGDPDGTGFAVVTVTGTTVRYTVFFQNIATATAAHIHDGPSGVAGAVVINFGTAFTGNAIIGEATGVAQDLINRIIANPSGFYVNVHNAEFPGGAIRGQLASAPTESGSRVVYVPVVGKVAGAAGTNFVTDVRIINRTGATANVTLDYFQQSTAGQTAPTATRAFTVAPGEQEVLDDVIGLLNSSSLGGLRVTSDQNVEVLARVINDQRAASQGTTGFSVDARELSEATVSGTLGFLSNASPADIGAGTGFRTNLGYFNASATPVTLTLRAHRTGDGSSLGTTTITVPGFSQVQGGVFAQNLIGSVAAADQAQPNFYVTWSASAPIFVYGAVVDNRTGDSVLIQ